MRGCFLDSLLTAVGLRMPARISERCSALPEPGESLGGGGVGFTGALRHEYLCWARGGPPCHNRASLSQAGSRAWGAASLSLGSRLICTQVDAGSVAPQCVPLPRLPGRMKRGESYVHLGKRRDQVVTLQHDALNSSMSTRLPPIGHVRDWVRGC